MLALDVDGLNAFLEAEFPQARRMPFVLEAVQPRYIRLSMQTEERHLRPGGTVSGPVQMTLADTAAYLLILAHRGPVALAVTTSLNASFMRRPLPGVVIAEGRMLKLGRRLAVVDVHIHGGDPEAVYCQATVTYSLPPTPSEGAA